MEASEKTENDQAYRRKVIYILKDKLPACEPWRETILGADDKEVAMSTSDFDQQHVLKKTRHVDDALQVLVDSAEQRSQ